MEEQQQQQQPKTVSYSQFNIYANCPRKWKLDYLENRRVFTQSIFTVFGTSMHKTLQNYLEILYNKSTKEANEICLPDYLKQTLFNEYKDSLAKNGNKHYTTPEELAEFCLEGEAIVNFFHKNISTYFPTKDHKLVGIEIPLQTALINNLVFTGYIDIVIHNEATNRYKICDFKTSTMGWNKYQKADQSKIAQLILYKEFYAKQFKTDVELIDVEYIILRRKINDQAEFKPKRIQIFVPASGKPTRNKIGKLFIEFVQNCFLETGEYNTTSVYPAIKSSACNYCPHKQNEALCPKKERKSK